MNALAIVLMAASAAVAPQLPVAGQLPPSQNSTSAVAAPQPAPDLGPEGTMPAAVGPRGATQAPDWVNDDGLHRIEVRQGVWRRPRFSHHEPVPDVHTGSADFALGVEYLRYISPDVAVGFGTLARVRATGEHIEDGDSWSSGGVTVSFPFVARWNFARRATRWHTIEPYLTGGIGPLVRTDWIASEVDDDDTASTDTEMTIGARLGIGFDAHIGSVWTIGVQAAWNWSDKPGSVLGYGRHDRGGEVAVTMGWGFGRRSAWRD